jgi:hypothetical protein
MSKEEFGFDSIEPNLNSKMITLCENALRNDETKRLKEYTEEKKKRDRVEFTIYETWMR